ncbi:MAG: prephenate dehydratase [Bacillota bacterium]|nr:MAG: prephenate dehydratase [Bacillota bacterium]
MEDLKKVRDKIDKIDGQIADLFVERMNEVEEVTAVKQKNNIPVYNPAREREVLNRVADRVPEKYDAYSRVLFSAMFELSRSYQSALTSSSALEDTLRAAVGQTKADFPERATVACQGVEGAYSSLAAGKLFKLPNILYFRHWEGVFSAVEKGLCKYGVLPIENSSNGSVNGVYDLMLNHNFYIVRTIKLHISHVLLAKDGVKAEEIKEIYSHEQALGQCSEFLKAHPDVKINVCENTAAAAKIVAESERRDVAAISSANCAELYNLKVLSRKVQNSENNYTRFICISKEPEIYAGANKISLMLTLPHRSGALYRVMSKFNALDLNLCKLESRPIVGSDFEFMFYFDIEAEIHKESVLKLMSELSSSLERFVFLGAYSEL